jgi:hypothetical protein
MPGWLRTFIAVIAGIVAGSVVNMALIGIGPHVIPLPAGADASTTDGLKSAMPSFEPRHFLFPWLAHAVGTFVGAFVATLLAPRRPLAPALAVGIFFLLGGIAAAVMLPAPLWFEVVDVVLAYLPAAWLAHRVAARSPADKRAKQPQA